MQENIFNSLRYLVILLTTLVVMFGEIWRIESVIMLEVACFYRFSAIFMNKVGKYSLLALIRINLFGQYCWRKKYWNLNCWCQNQCQ